MNANRRAVEVMGRIGLPRPTRELARQNWDVIVVGAGHNGLTCAAYLARAGRRVLVLEARERIGGACTLEEPWPGFRVSPCAYLSGLLHPLVTAELNMPAYGFHWTPARAPLDRTLLPERARWRSRSARQAHHEPVRTVCPLCLCGRGLG